MRSISLSRFIAYQNRTMPNYHALIEEQKRLCRQLVLEDRLADGEPEFIAGADVGFEADGTVTRAAIALLHYPSLTLFDYRIARITTEIPYIPGLLSFREVPALIEAWQQLPVKPSLVLVDGQGIAHPRRLGVASHFGLFTSTPTIGVAKSRLCGQYSELPESIGDAIPLMDKSELLGYVLKSKARCKPLFISPGHMMSQESALLWVRRCLKGYRLPEPTRWADLIASNKPAFQRWKAKQQLILPNDR